MVEPRVVARAEHSLSRRDVDPDALRVLYRLRQYDHTAYLVGGSVRDLLIGRRPKDFDIGTSAHPYQVKKLFRNCWIIGRRFRLAHVKFGTKVIEVATFRRQVAPGEEVVQDGVPAPIQAAPGVHTPAAADADHLIHRDNTFGTPEEDAFRRDFTINALFYDIATFSIIDYVGGLDDLRAGLVRSIGDPAVRFREDPVRMMRAVALAARLDFTIDERVLEAIETERGEIARSSPPRLLEEYYKILRAGAAERTFRDLARLGLLEPISKELHRGAADTLWQSLANLDAHRRRFESTPGTLTNPILLGSLIAPLGLMARDADAASNGASEHEADQGRHSDRFARRRRGGRARREAAAARWSAKPGAESQVASEPAARRGPVGPRLGELPLARRDLDRLQQLLGLQRRLGDVSANPRAKLALTHRSIFQEALAWMEIHGEAPEIVDHWKALSASTDTPSPTSEGATNAATDVGAAVGTDGATDAPRPRRRRRRRHRRPRPASGG
jgi:poly(A) polymerase